MISTLPHFNNDIQEERGPNTHALKQNKATEAKRPLGATVPNNQPWGTLHTLAIHSTTTATIHVWVKSMTSRDCYRIVNDNE
jgi:hypothetical protein